MKFEKFIEELQSIQNKGEHLIAYYITLEFSLKRPYNKTVGGSILKSIDKNHLGIYNRTELENIDEEITLEFSPTIYITNDNIDFVSYKLDKLVGDCTTRLESELYKDIHVNTFINKEYVDIYDLAEDCDNYKSILQIIREEIKFRKIR